MFPYLLLVSIAGYGLLAWLLAQLIATRQPLPFAEILFFAALATAVPPHRLDQTNVVARVEQLFGLESTDLFSHRV